MSEGFRTITVADPNKLKSFIEATTGSAMAVMEVRISCLFTFLSKCKQSQLFVYYKHYKVHIHNTL